MRGPKTKQTTGLHGHENIVKMAVRILILPLLGFLALVAVGKYILRSVNVVISSRLLSASIG